MARYSDDFLAKVTDASSIEDVVSSYVRLDKRSGSNLFGLCPFHSEKTGSFSVSPSKQIFHCFGCGKGGGVITFIMEIENLSFPEAVEFLAKRAGIPLPEQEEDPAGRRKARLHALNREAARFFYQQLTGPTGGLAAEYVSRRRISAKTATDFGLGYADDSWSSLCDAMKAKGYSERDLLEADLARRGKNGGIYDTFRSRLVFPVIDVRGNVTGFSGRALGDFNPKYLNTGETPVFTKGQNIFGINLAKKSKSDYFILVEGNVDVVSLHQAGFDSAVAALGTAFTPDQARLLSRYKQQVVLAYDSDEAGRKASQRSIGILEKLDVKVKVLSWTGAKDPDDFIKLYGADAFRALIEKSEDQLDYRLGRIKAKYDLTQPGQKVDFLREATALLATVPGTMKRQVYAAQVAEAAGVAQDAVISEVERQRKKRFAEARKREGLSPAREASPMQSVKYENPESAVAEQGIVRLMYLDSAVTPSARELVSPEEFTSPELRHIFEVLLSLWDRNSAPNPAVLQAELSTGEMSLLISLANQPEVLSEAENTLRQYIKRVKEVKSGKETDLLKILEEQRKGKAYKT